MNLQRVLLGKLISSNQPRPLLTSEVDKLASSIKEVGLIQPITVIQSVAVAGVAEQGFQIVAGHHRVAACRALGWTEIDALVIEDASHLQSELIEIDENLCRAELTGSQRTGYIKRRKQIFEAMHPNGAVKLEVGTDFPLQDELHGGPRPHPLNFAASTAEATGMTKRAINQHIARADALGEEALTKVANTSLDSGVELDALAKLAAPQRALLIERAAAGEKVSARTPSTPATKPDQTDFFRLSCSVQKAVRGVLDEAGCLSIEELGKQIKRQSKLANDDDICIISAAIDLLEKLAFAMQNGEAL
jgi:hypothetical protein